MVGLSERDAAVLDALITAGADPAEPRQVLYFLYFETAEGAESAATEARPWGFSAEVGTPPPEFPTQWSVICEKRGLVLTPETVRANSARFEALASAHGGEFDGWEASV